MKCLFHFPATHLPRKIALDSLAIMAALAALAIPRNNSSRRLIQIRLKLIMMQFIQAPTCPKMPLRFPGASSSSSEASGSDTSVKSHHIRCA